ncbi:MAG: MotA/TolQ/ExbB proton channel family protein [Candidatus Methylomirabilales bacterium]
MARKSVMILVLGGLFLLGVGRGWGADPPAPEGPEEGLIRGKRDTLVTLYLKGGPTMHFITLCSVLALAIVLERLVNLRKSKIISPQFLEEIKRHWYRREIPQAMAVCKEYDIALSRILRAGLLRFDLGLEEIERAIEDTGRREATLLRKNLGLLNFLAQMAPLLGLFGTVLGMTRSFDAIAKYGQHGNIEMVAGGIAEALLTTVYGLMVGIPALGFYYYFRRKVEVRVSEMEAVVVGLLEDLAYQEKRPREREALREGRPLASSVESEEPAVEVRRERPWGVKSYERPL